MKNYRVVMRIRLFPLIALLFLSLGTVAAQQSNCWDGSIAEAYAGGDGTADNPYQIATAEQLALLEKQTNEGSGGDAYYILTSDICLNENLNFNPLRWKPIGRVLNEVPYYFSGYFDGNGKTITGLYIDDASGDKVVGLFGCTNGAEILNIKLLECQISGSMYVGTLVGCAGLTHISGCDVDNATVTCETRSAGGLVGFFGLPYGVSEDVTDTCRVVNCNVTRGVTVFGKLSGGLVGEISEYLLWGPSVPCAVSDCIVQAVVMGTESVGGLAGFFRNGRIDSCISWNEVHSGQMAGGLVGCGIALDLYNCLNCADATGNYYSGGMVGKLYAGNLTHCKNYGKIDGGCPSGGGISEIGGMVGRFYPDPLLAGTDYVNKVRDCHNYGEITNSGDDAGGIIGYSEASAIERLVIVDCSNTGRVHNNFGEAGGIIGYNHNFVMSILNTYNTATIGARYGVGGIVGRANYLMEAVMNVYHSGDLVHEINNYVCPRGTIVGWDPVVNQFSSCYWLENTEYGSNGNGPEIENSTAFIPTNSPLAWQLETPMHNTTDLLAALNAGAAQIENEFPLLGEVSRWCEDAEMNNGGFPIFGNQWPNGINETVSDAHVCIYPNPANNLVHIDGIEVSEVQVYNALGQSVRSVQGSNEINVSGLSEGVCLLRISDANGIVYTKKITIR